MVKKQLQITEYSSGPASNSSDTLSKENRDTWMSNQSKMDCFHRSHRILTRTILRAAALHCSGMIYYYEEEIGERFRRLSTADGLRQATELFMMEGQQ